MPINSEKLRIALAFALGSALAFASSGSDSQDAREEQTDRVVDRASADTQTEAETDLLVLTKKYAGTAREAELQLRLGELRMELSQTMFRVAYAPGQESLRRSYQNTLNRAIAPLSRVIDAFPRSAEYPRALFLRGKAYRLLSKNAPAAKDLEKFIAQFPKRPEAGLAAIGIADISIETKNFKRVISVLAPMVAKPSNPLYPNALQKRAWAFQVDGKPHLAISELKKLSTFFKNAEASGNLTQGLAVLRETVIGDAPSIAYLGYRAQPQAISLTGVNQLFRTFSTTDGYRQMAAQFADRLRAGDLSNDLMVWKQLVLKSDPATYENLAILVGVLEYDLERDSYAAATQDAADIANILKQNPQAPEADAARALMVKMAEKLTKRMTEYRKDAKSTEAERYLKKLFVSIDAVVAKNDFRRIAVRWNFAETLFSMERFDSAADVYHWIESNWNDDLQVPSSVAKAVSARAAGIKAIETRYAALQKSGVIPKDLKAQAGISPKLKGHKLDDLREWIQWLEIAAKRETGDQRGEDLNQFLFEANRSLYQAGYVDEAIERLRAHAIAYPKSKVAIPSASLVVDTWIERKNWERVEAYAVEFAEVKGWTTAGFSTKMIDQASQARLKRAEIAYSKRAYAEARTHAERYLELYPSSRSALDARGISCNSSIELKDQDEALKCLGKVAEKSGSAPTSRQALLSSAQIEDERMNFKEAATLYGRYLIVSGKSLSKAESYKVRERIVKLTAADGKPSDMRAIAGNRKICQKDLSSECEKTLSLAFLIEADDSKRARNQAVRLAEKSAPALRSIWATAAIQQWNDLSIQSRKSTVRALVASWKNSDASTRYYLIPRLNRALPDMLKQERQSLRKRELSTSGQSILIRIQNIQEWEKNADLVGTLPLSSVRIAVLDQTSGAYQDLVADLEDLSPAKGSNDYQKAEHKKLIAQMTEPFAAKARKIANARGSLERERNAGMDVSEFGRIWKKTDSSGDERFSNLQDSWSSAVRSENWSRVAFFSDEAAHMKRIPGAWVKAARAVSLARTGAISEAKAVFSDACREASRGSSLSETCEAAGWSKKYRGNRS